MTNQRTKKRSPHNRYTRGLCTALAFVFLFCTALSLPAATVGIVSAGNTAKISADLLARMEASEDPDEMFPVDIWLNLITPEAIDVEMQASYGISLQSFENEEVYRTQTLPAIEAEVVQKNPTKTIDQSVGEVLETAVSSYSLKGLSMVDTTTMAQTIQAQDEVLEYLSIETIKDFLENDLSLLDLYFKNSL